MDKKERIVCFYDLKPEARSATHPSPTPLTVNMALRAIEQLSLEDRIASRSDSAQIYGLARIRVSDTEAELLFFRSDKRQGDPIFRNHNDHSVREINKLIDEGQYYSAHAVVRFHTNPIFPAKLYLEQVPGLGATRVAKILGRLLKRTKKSNPNLFLEANMSGAVDASGAPVMERITHELHIRGIASSEFSRALNSGTFAALDLIGEGQAVSELDQEMYFEEKNTILRLGISENAPQNLSRFSQVGRILDDLKYKYPNARLVFKSQSGAPQRVNWTSQQGWDEHYIRKERISKFGFDLKSAYAELFDPILVKIRGLADANP